MTDRDQPARTGSAAAPSVLVWDWPLRVLHWLLAASVLTAYFTANVFDAIHEIAGYTVMVVIALRILWGFAGNRYARFGSFALSPATLLRYLIQMLRGESGAYLGLNPAGAAMALALLVLLIVATISGWMQLTQRFFGVEWVETVHTWSANAVIILVVIHVLGVAVTSLLQRENLVRAMITGRKRVPRDAPPQD